MRRVSLLGCAVVVLGLAVSAQAASVTHSVTIPNLPTVDWGETISLPQYTVPHGYTLNSATVTLQGSVVGSAQSTNNSLTSKTFNVTRGAQISTVFPDAIAALAQPEAVGTFTNLPAGSTGTISPFNDTETFSHTYTGGDLSAFFVGAGTVDFVVDSSIYTTSPSYTTSSFVSYPGAVLSITYDYAVPSPGVVAAGVVLLGGLLLRRRLQKRHAV